MPGGYDDGSPVPDLTQSHATAPEAKPRDESLKANGGWWVLAATILASSMAFIDGTAVTVALPALQGAFGASASQIQWVIESYALFLASLLLVAGSLGDRYGRRLMFLLGVALFAVGSVLCGLAPGIWPLIAARGLQGVGAALLVPGSLAIISAFFPVGSRGRAIGIWSGFSAMTAAIGPVLGGWLVDHTSWRWVFFINPPLALAILLITFWRVPESRNEKMTRSLDGWGAVLATVALGGITFALLEARQRGPIVTGAALIGGAASVGLWFVERRAKAPMLPLGLFRSRTFAGANLLTLFLYTALNGLLFFFPLNLIQVQGYTATEAGAALLPLILILFLLSHWSGGLIERYGARKPLTVGCSVAALGFALAGRPGIGGSYWTTFFPAVAVLGTGMAISVAPLTTAVMNSVPVEDAGVASGINNAISRLASLLSVAIFGVVLLGAFHHTLGRRMDEAGVPTNERGSIEAQRQQLAGVQTKDPRARRAVNEAFVYGFHRIIWMAVALSLAGVACAQVLTDERSVFPENRRTSDTDAVRV